MPAELTRVEEGSLARALRTTASGRAAKSAKVHVARSSGSHAPHIREGATPRRTWNFSSRSRKGVFQQNGSSTDILIRRFRSRLTRGGLTSVRMAKRVAIIVDNYMFYRTNRQPANVPLHRRFGAMAEWSCRGLQILVRRFDSGSRLQTHESAVYHQVS